MSATSPASLDTSHPIELRNESGSLRARIDHARGGSLMDLCVHASALGRTGVHEWVPIVSRNVPGEDPRLKPGCFFMAPWCNRLAGAAFEFGGKRHALRPTNPQDATAMHGDVRSRPWTILDRSPFSARLRFDSRQHNQVNFPWAFTLDARYELEGDALRVECSLRNADAEPFPAGIGLHPYFPRLPFPGAGRVRISAPTRGRYTSREMLPSAPAVGDALSRRFRSPAFLPEVAIDDVFDGFVGGASIDWGDLGVIMSCSPELGHLVLYAPRTRDNAPEPFFAVEPVSQVNNAFNLMNRPPSEGWGDTGTRVLQPAQAMSIGVEFRIRAR